MSILLILWLRLEIEAVRKESRVEIILYSFSSVLRVVMIVQYPALPVPSSFSEDPANNIGKPVLSLHHERRIAAPTRASVLVFEDLCSRALLERIRLIAPSGGNALIVGETGTGKELIASHLHASECCQPVPRPLARAPGRHPQGEGPLEPGLFGFSSIVLVI